jgi:Flp pilus assembly protein TadG
MYRANGRTCRRLADDSGAVMVEAAFITPIFVFLLFGILEFGGVFRDYLTIGDAASSGARAASIQGNTQNADWEIMQAVKRSARAIPRSQLTDLVIFKASGPNSVATTACKSGGVTVGTAANPGTGSCNHYGPSDLALTTLPTTWNCSTGPYQYWCPPTRQVTLLPDPPGPDYLGIWIKVEHPFATGLFGNTIDLTATSITKLEPQRLTA